MSIGAGNLTLPRLRMSNTERDAKDFKWHHGQSYVWGVSIMDLHEHKTTQLTGYLWPRCDGCAGRSSSGSLAKLGRYPSSLRPHLFGFRDYPEMVTFIHSIAEVVRMKWRGLRLGRAILNA
jgi:hypothetical protein